MFVNVCICKNTFHTSYLWPNINSFFIEKKRIHIVGTSTSSGDTHTVTTEKNKQFFNNGNPIEGKLVI